jgi:hypothetical protein
LKFKGAVDVVESSNGSPWSHPAATKIVFNELNALLTLCQPKQATLLKTSWQPPKHSGATLLRYSSNASAVSNEAHRDLKKKIYNDALTGSDTNPCTYD